MTTSRINRAGTSLTEVLIALFVMALGMISLLSLFPYGASNMRQAMRDNRCAQTATQADVMMRLWWQSYVIEPGLQTPPVVDPWKLDSPGPGYTAVATTDSGPSFPLVVDPLGFQMRASKTTQTRLAADWTSSNVALRMPRGNVAAVTSLVQGFTACSLKDDVVFSETGDADTSGSFLPGKISRGGIYNWFAVVQRPNNNLRNTANLTIGVFNDRPAQAGGASVGAEQVYSATITPNSSQVTIAVVAGNLPPLSKGGWIMDGTISTSPAIRNANFYRVQSISDNGGTWMLDLQTPIKRPLGATSSAGYAGQIYIFSGLAEVFERPQLSAADHQQQTP